MTAAALAFDGVWKQFPALAGGARTLHSTLVRPFHARRRPGFWALRNVNLVVQPGETTGLIGPNGAGKSTLLRLAGGVGQASRGRITRNGRLGSILSLGDSFHPALTGRENAITAGILNGYTRREALAKLPDIVRFAEIEEFIDEPVRTYSSGMTLRLAFAVAASAEPELLLVDEVLAVGDLRFQRKCLARMRELQDAGTTIVLASHDEEQVRSLCQRVIWLDRGSVRANGSPDTVYDEYRDAMRALTEQLAAASPRVAVSEAALAEHRIGTLEVEIVGVRIAAAADQGRPSSPLRVEIDLVPRTTIEDAIVAVSVRRVVDGAKILDVNTEADGARLGVLREPSTVVLEIDRLDAEGGLYHLDVGVFEQSWRYVYDYHWQAYTVEVPARPGAVFGPPRRWSISS